MKSISLPLSSKSSSLVIASCVPLNLADLCADASLSTLSRLSATLVLLSVRPTRENLRRIERVEGTFTEKPESLEYTCGTATVADRPLGVITFLSSRELSLTVRPAKLPPEFSSG